MTFDRLYKLISESVNVDDEYYLELAKEPDKNKDILQRMVNLRAEELNYNTTVYHATNSVKPFYKFDMSRIGKASGSSDVNGIFVAEKKETSEFYLPTIEALNPNIEQQWYDSNAIEDELGKKAKAKHSKDINRTTNYPSDNDLKQYMTEDEWIKFIKAYNFSRMILKDKKSLDPKYWIEKRIEAGRIMELLLKPYDILQYDAQGSNWIPDFWKKIHRLSNEKFGAIGGSQTGSGPSIYKVTNFYDGPIGIEDTVYAVFDPSLLKLFDPVTYDDEENIIPLSQRFDSTKDDIRY